MKVLRFLTKFLRCIGDTAHGVVAFDIEFMIGLVLTRQSRLDVEQIDAMFLE